MQGYRINISPIVFITNFYRPQRSWGKVMFLHVSVILFTGGCLVQGEGLVPGGCLVQGDVWSRGCLVQGGLLWWGGPDPGRVCVETPLTTTAVGGTHPTGMHSCKMLLLP